MIAQVVKENKEIKNHMSKLTNALAVDERGKFPAQAQPNPKGQHMAQTSRSEETNFKEANAITTRSRKVVEQSPPPTDNRKEPSKSNENSPIEEVVENLARIHFPQALKLASKSTCQHNEILEHLRQVKINLPLLHVISQVPTYAKVLKDLCTLKRKHHVKKIAFVTEQVSDVIEQRIPPKYKDPGCPTISCVIGNREFAQALLDLGASVNLMPYAISVPRSGRDETHLSVLDVKVEVDVNSKIPIILGRPFLPTVIALINCRNGLMKLTFGNITLEVNIFHITKQPMEEDECHQTYMIDTLTKEEAPTTIDSDPLNSFILNTKILCGFDVNEYANICAVFAKLQDHRTSPW
ncbi:uncharacterized protein LOC111376930 [Olea europaea var. sylvestris]|uniref:uncharacterized protein LOC111376930 n=1 Tax=Olea europaea var. sylvestris TaxID=158386 RepID=UPI000C1D42BC|nr:uncharacterized protein LOC111376930 [Olea europaea var. sylvestris]